MENELISIVVRTCGRPHVLGKALRSIQNQSYPNIEVVIVEDGENISEKYIMANFPELHISYHCTGEECGRSTAGNLGMKVSNGKYINFLDDDDYLLPCHVETLAKELERTGYMAAYSIAEEHQIRKAPQNPEKITIKRKLVRYRQPYNKLLLCYLNYIPIQSIMFRKALYEEMGGFDTELEVLEDWDLWLRYSACCDFLYIPTVTSVYHTPYKGKQKHQRESSMHKAGQDILKKYQQHPISFNLPQVNKEMDYILNIYNKKGFLFYMQKIRNYLLYRDI